MRILAIGAHPDDCDLCFGGTAALYARAGHQVKFISATNGDTGHHRIGGGALARRRYDELRAKGEEVAFEEILANVRERDYIDSHRAVAPLRQAPDALVLDNSHMSIEEQDAWLWQAFQKAVNSIQ